MRKFLIKLFVLSLPVIILLILFAVLDPFKVVKNYDDYYYDVKDTTKMLIPLNWDYVTSEVFLKNAARYRYNSFIFGGSRTIAYKTKDWVKHLDADARPFVFSAYSESLFGIYTKIKYLDKNGYELKNCIVLLDADHSFEYNTEIHGHLFLKHPAIAGTSWLNFYSEFIKSYFDPDFLWSYYSQYFLKKAESLKGDWVIWSTFNFNPVTNDMITGGLDELINKDPAGYYEKRSKIFYTRDSALKVSEPEISDDKNDMLKEIKKIFDKQHTKYKVVVSPLYSQIKLNPVDKEKLNGIFGSENVYDFSGRNWITADKENYYESSHYREHIGDYILNEIYRK